MCCAAAIARGSCRSEQHRRAAASAGESFNSTAVENASVPSEPTRMCARLTSFLRHQRIDVVAADAALHLGKARRDLIGLAGAQREQVARQRLERRQLRQVGQVCRNGPEVRLLPSARRASTTSTFCTPCCRRRSERPPQELFAVMPPMVAREAVETSTGNHSPCGLSARLRSSSTMPGSTRAAPAGHVEVKHARQVLGAVDDDGLVHRLAGLRGAAAARQHAHALGAANPDRAFGFFYRARDDHAERHDLVVRGVGRIAAAGEAVEIHAGADFGVQSPLQARQQPFRQRISRFLTATYIRAARPGAILISHQGGTP